MILDTEVEVKLAPANIEHYKNLGYKLPRKKSFYKKNGKLKEKEIYDCSNPILVRIKDLPKGSHIKIPLSCDYCGDNFLKEYCYYITSHSVVHKDACKNCNIKKQDEVCRILYGENYKVEYIKKIHDIYFENTGYHTPFENPEVQKKVKESCYNHYGVYNPSEVNEIKIRKNQTFFKNESIRTSNQQRYLHKVYGGILNYPEDYYNLDIGFPEEKFYVEFSGMGHYLSVITGQMTQEEFDKREIIRTKFLKNKGYRKMEIICLTNELPSDTILLQMLSEARTYFSTYPSHSWIEFNISTSTVRNAENKNGTPYDFGALRTIKNSDLCTIENKDLDAIENSI